MRRATKFIAISAFLIPFFLIHIPNAFASPPNFSDLNLMVMDQSEASRPMPDVTLKVPILTIRRTVVVNGLPIMDREIDYDVILNTDMDGTAIVKSVQEGELEIVGTWRSAFNPEPVLIVSSRINHTGPTSIFLNASVYDVTLQLVTPQGRPIPNVAIALAGVSLGLTDAEGEITAVQVPSWHTPTQREYPVTATWFGADVSPNPVMVQGTGVYRLVARDMANLTVQVLGARGQDLSRAQVDVRNSAGTMVFSGVANKQGVASVEVPYGTYSLRADYKGFTSTAYATVNTDVGTVQTMEMDVYIEMFGYAMNFLTFVLLIAMIVIVIAIIIATYILSRRKRLPPPPEFPPPPPG